MTREDLIEILHAEQELLDSKEEKESAAFFIETESEDENEKDEN